MCIYRSNTVFAFLGDKVYLPCDKPSSYEHNFCVFGWHCCRTCDELISPEFNFCFFRRQNLLRGRQPMSLKNTVFVFWVATCFCRTYKHSVFLGDKWCLPCDSFCRTNAISVFLGDRHVTWKTLKCITIIIIFLYYCNCCCCCLVMSLLLFIIITLFSLINVCLLTYDRDERLVEPSAVPLKPAAEMDNTMYKV